ncbi:MAG: DMT family transporter [Crocinitomicaceae bacterium]|nr:DMT family transporter [Crocinitomicaceae bacterium]
MKSANQSWIILIFLAFVWGSSFILMKKSMYPTGGEMVLDPYQVGTLRIVLAGLVLLPFAIRDFRFLTKKDFFLLTVAGVTGNLIPATLFTLAETEIDSSLAGMLNMGTSFFVVLIGIFFYKSKPSMFQVAGLICGATGLYMILHSQIKFDFGKIEYALLILLATLSYAICLTTVKFRLQHLPALAITSLAFFIILWPALISTVLLGTFDPLVNHPDGMKALGFLAILSVVGTALAVVLFYKLVSIASHIFATGVTYLMPVVAIFLGVLDGDDFKLANIPWIALIITGVWLLNNGPKKLFK